MRTTTTVAKTHDGKWVLLASPGVPLIQQWKAFRLLLGSKSSDKFSYVQIQDSDGHERHINLLTPAKAQEQKEHHDAQLKEHQEAGVLEAKNQKQIQKETELERVKAHEAEIDRLNALGSETRGPAKKADSEPEVKKPEEIQRDAEGLRTDGPTIEEWKANGMDETKYPPAGFAAKSAAQTQPPATPPTP